jgi:hypothetical protein
MDKPFRYMRESTESVGIRRIGRETRTLNKIEQVEGNFFEVAISTSRPAINLPLNAGGHWSPPGDTPSYHIRKPSLCMSQLPDWEICCQERLEHVDRLSLTFSPVFPVTWIRMQRGKEVHPSSRFQGSRNPEFHSQHR